jgi:hypothetical protein
MIVSSSVFENGKLELSYVEAQTMLCKADDLTNKNARTKIGCSLKAVKNAMEFLHKHFKCEKEGGMVNKARNLSMLVTDNGKTILNKSMIVGKAIIKKRKKTVRKKLLELATLLFLIDPDVLFVLYF